MLVYLGSNLMPVGYIDSAFQLDPDSRKSTSGSLFTLNGGAIVWRSVKQSCVSDSTMEAEYVEYLRKLLKRLYGSVNNYAQTNTR